MLHVCVRSRVLTLEKEVLEVVQPLERKLHSKLTRVVGPSLFCTRHAGWRHSKCADLGLFFLSFTNEPI